MRATVGASLLAIAVGQSISMLNVISLSRASSLPQGNTVLSGEYGVSGNTNPGTRAGVCGVPLQPYTSAAIAALKVLLGRMALLVSSGLAK
ncbi:hypothetical protein FHJ31_21875 [Pseudomonas sp. Fig-3]|nr:hypothetical protein FHJ31_21875 [Pseudomonas sp. Fig-3]